MICPPQPPAPLVEDWLDRHRDPGSFVLHMIGIPPTILGVLLIPVYVLLLSVPLFLLRPGRCSSAATSSSSSATRWTGPSRARSWLLRRKLGSARTSRGPAPTRPEPRSAWPDVGAGRTESVGKARALGRPVGTATDGPRPRPRRIARPAVRFEPRPAAGEIRRIRTIASRRTSSTTDTVLTGRSVGLRPAAKDSPGAAGPSPIADAVSGRRTQGWGGRGHREVPRTDAGRGVRRRPADDRWRAGRRPAARGGAIGPSRPRTTRHMAI